MMYRANKNLVWEWLQVRGRRHFFDHVVERSDMRQTLRLLKSGRTRGTHPIKTMDVSILYCALL